MPRSARIEYPGAIYHVINRGNYRWDVFGSAGAAKAFVAVLEETVRRYGWELGAFVVMRNHFHLAVRTPQPNLSTGMHWLQATFAIRFNRLRGECGHLFQGRYKAILLKDEGIWARVADYIHLNPVRAGIVQAPQIASFRWSSLRAFVQGSAFQGLSASSWLSTLGLADREADWGEYVLHLVSVQAREMDLPPDKRESYSKGWALGPEDWKTELIKAYGGIPKSAPNAEYVEPREGLVLRWQERLRELMLMRNLKDGDLEQTGRAARWKIELADQMQQEMGVPVVWLAGALKVGRPASLRTMLWRRRRTVDM